MSRPGATDPWATARAQAIVIKQKDAGRNTRATGSGLTMVSARIVSRERTEKRGGFDTDR